MLYLVTGTPGSGKTLNTIKFISESKQFAEVNGTPRQVYYFGIRDLSPDLGWIELDEQQALNWFDLPPASVIVFDEAYNIFPVKHPGKSSPEHVTRLATHRHHGFDIFLICQKVNGQLDTFIRGLINRHQHYARVMGSLTVNRFTWDVCVTNPDSRSIRKDANKDTLRMDKKYFGKYHSADEHTHTMSIPWRLIFIIAGCVIGFALASWFVYNSLVPEGLDAAASAGSKDQPMYIDGPSGYSSRHSQEDMTFGELFSPEVETLPWSAPVYREQLQAQSWPRPAACILRPKSGRCTCYTQQATRLDVTQEFCLTHVREGFFDWTKPDPARVAGQGGDSHSPGARAADAPRPEMGDDTRPSVYGYHPSGLPEPPRSNPRAILIDHTPTPRMPTSSSSW